MIRKQCNIGKYEKFETDCSSNTDECSQMHLENLNLCQTNIYHSPIIQESLRAKSLSTPKFSFNTPIAKGKADSNFAKKHSKRKSLKQKEIASNDQNSFFQPSPKFQTISQKAKIKQRISVSQKSNLSTSSSTRLAHKKHEYVSMYPSSIYLTQNLEQNVKSNNFANHSKFCFSPLRMKDLDDSLDLFPHKDASSSSMTSQGDETLLPNPHRCDNITRSSDSSVNALPCLDEDFKMQDLIEFDSTLQTNKSEDDQPHFIAPNHNEIPALLAATTANQQSEQNAMLSGYDIPLLLSSVTEESSSKQSLLNPSKKVKFDLTQQNQSPQLCSSFTSSSDDTTLHVYELQEDSDVERESRFEATKVRSLIHQQNFFEESQKLNNSYSKQTRRKSEEALVKAVTDAKDMIGKVTAGKLTCVADSDESSAPSSDEEDVLLSSLNRLSFTFSQFTPLGLSLKVLRLHRILQDKNDEQRENIMSLNR